MVALGSKLMSATLPNPKVVKTPIGPLHTPSPIPLQPRGCHWAHEKNREVERPVHCHTACEGSKRQSSLPQPLTPNPRPQALTALDVPVGKVVVIMVCVDTASVLPQVSIAAVMLLTAPGGRRQEEGQAGGTAAQGWKASAHLGGVKGRLGSSLLYGHASEHLLNACYEPVRCFVCEYSLTLHHHHVTGALM